MSTATHIAFTVPGIPVAQPRQRHSIATMGGKSFVRNYTSTRHPVNTFKAAVQMAASQVYSEAPMDCAVELVIVAVFPRLKSRIWKTRAMVRTPKTGRPDWDNVGKAVADALTGILWADDSQVTDAIVRKREASGDEQPHCEIEVRAIQHYEPNTHDR